MNHQLLFQNFKHNILWTLKKTINKSKTNLNNPKIYTINKRESKIKDRLWDKVLFIITDIRFKIENLMNHF